MVLFDGAFTIPGIAALVVSVVAAAAAYGNDSRWGCAGRRAEKYDNGKLQNGLVHYVQYAPAAPLAKQGPVKEKVA